MNYFFNVILKTFPLYTLIHLPDPAPKKFCKNYVKF